VIDIGGGVEFAGELHRIAARNVDIYERHTGRPSHIETVCMDATEFSIPERPVVLFFYSPFLGDVMRKVVDNVSSSFERNPRPVVIVFYGRSPSSIGMLRDTGFDLRELQVRPDWSKFIQYRALIFTSPSPPNAT